MTYKHSYKCNVCGETPPEQEEPYKRLCTISNIDGGGLLHSHINVHICTECCEKTTIAVLIKRLSNTFNDST